MKILDKKDLNGTKYNRTFSLFLFSKWSRNGNDIKFKEKHDTLQFKKDVSADASSIVSILTPENYKMEFSLGKRVKCLLSTPGTLQMQQSQAAETLECNLDG